MTEFKEFHMPDPNFERSKIAGELAAPNAVWGLACFGHAAQIVTLIEKLAPEQQAEVLASPGAVAGLACYGQAARTVALIEKLAPEQQAAILAARDAVWNLEVWNGQKEASGGKN